MKYVFTCLTQDLYKEREKNFLNNKYYMAYVKDIKKAHMWGYGVNVDPGPPPNPDDPNTKLSLLIINNPNVILIHDPYHFLPRLTYLLNPNSGRGWFDDQNIKIYPSDEVDQWLNNDELANLIVPLDTCVLIKYYNPSTIDINEFIVNEHYVSWKNELLDVHNYFSPVRFNDIYDYNDHDTIDQISDMIVLTGGVPVFTLMPDSFANEDVQEYLIVNMFDPNIIFNYDPDEYASAAAFFNDTTLLNSCPQSIFASFTIPTGFSVYNFIDWITTQLITGSSSPLNIIDMLDQCEITGMEPIVYMLADTVYQDILYSESNGGMNGHVIFSTPLCMFYNIYDESKYDEGLHEMVELNTGKPIKNDTGYLFNLLWTVDAGYGCLQTNRYIPLIYHCVGGDPNLDRITLINGLGSIRMTSHNTADGNHWPSVHEMFRRIGIGNPWEDDYVEQYSGAINNDSGLLLVDKFGFLMTGDGEHYIVNSFSGWYVHINDPLIMLDESIPIVWGIGNIIPIYDLY